MLETILLVVLAVCLIATVIWAADKYLVVPPPFSWVRGLLMFALIVAGCYLVWAIIEGHHGFAGGHWRGFP